MHYILEFLSNIDVSPKNVHFNVSAVSNFIKGYKGDELSRWDVAFAVGMSDSEVNIGNGIAFRYPRRLFTVENDGKILKMNGAKHRIGASSDGVFGLTGDQFEQLEKAKGEKAFSQREYFTKISRNPLLVIYFVELHTRDDEKNTELLKMEADYKKEPVIGFGIGIPKLSDQETKYARYMLNKVALNQIFEGEFDDFDDDEVD